MEDKLITLGVGAVLDPDQLHVGQYSQLGGKIVIVDRIDGNKAVFLRPVVGWELFCYKTRQYQRHKKSSWVALTLVVITVFVLKIIYHLF